MARRPRSPKVALTAEQKKKQRQLRRELRKQSALEGLSPVTRSADRTPHQDAQFWMMTRDRMAAAKVVNDNRERPYWLSIPRESGIPPVSDFFPCSMFSRGGRWYYGFLFREHRDRQFKKWGRARKELTQ